MKLCENALPCPKCGEEVFYHYDDRTYFKHVLYCSCGIQFEKNIYFFDGNQVECELSKEEFIKLWNQRA